MPEIISHVHVAFSLFVIDEFGDGWVVAAYRAFVVGWKFDSMEGHGQGIVGKKSACKEITFSNNVFDGFHCLKASDHTSHGPDNTSLFAGWYCVLRRRIFEYTSVARTFSWYVGHQLSFKTDNTLSLIHI